MFEKKIFGLALLALWAFPYGLSAQTLDPNLASLEPFLGKTWVGVMKAPDGSPEREVICEYRALWNGKAVRSTRTIKFLQSFEEGTLYWDDRAKKIAFFTIHSTGVFSSGFLTLDKGTMTYEGKMTWPSPLEREAKQSFDFRNTFELVTESEMVDKWYQNAFGPWTPGHVISFKAREERPGRNLRQGETASIVVPEGKGIPVLLDGLFSPGEWEDAKRIPIHENVTLFMKTCGGYVFIGIKISPYKASVIDLFISPAGGKIHHFHASAQIGERLVDENSGRWDHPSFHWGNAVDWQANEIRWDEQKTQELIRTGKSESEAQEMANYQYEGFEFQIRQSKFGQDVWLFRVEVSMAPQIDKPVVFPAETRMKTTKGWIRLAFS